MGVQGLLGKCNFGKFDFSTYSRKRIAVDMYVIFHKFVMDEQIAKSITLNGSAYIEHYYELVKNYLQNFINNGFELYLVYDGNQMKYKITEDERAQKRLGCYIKEDWFGAVEITPQQMFNFENYIKFHPFIKDKQPINVPFVVAPFEADAQLAYLFKQGIVEAVLTNDSDLIIYGVKHILMIRKSGIETYDTEEDAGKEAVTINQINLEKLWLFGFLIGCDYAKGIKGIGIVKAFKIISDIDLNYVTTKIDWDLFWNRMCVSKILKMTNKKSLSNLEDYKPVFDLVRTIYNKQPIIDPRDYKLKYLDNTDVPDDKLDSYGKVYNIEDVAKGIIDPFSGKKFELNN